MVKKNRAKDESISVELRVAGLMVTVRRLLHFRRRRCGEAHKKGGLQGSCGSNKKARDEEYKNEI